MDTASDFTKAVQVVPKLVELLNELSPEERHRALSAAMILLGQPSSLGANPGSRSETGCEDDGTNPQDFSPKATSWMKKYSISREQLDHIFSIDALGIDVIAAKMPGKSKRQQTIESYVISGLSSFIQAGEPSFSDKDARVLCQKIGCYDSPNHHNYTRGFGNLIVGSKEEGWRLTNPGLNRAAQIVRELTGNSSA